MSKQKEGSDATVVIEEAPAKQETENEVSVADLAEAGLAEGEIEMAKKHGILPKDETPDTDEKSEEKKDGDSNGVQRKEEKGKEVLKSVDEKWSVLANGKAAETVISEIAEKGDLTPEQEKVLLASLSNNGKNLYWAQKYERRQKAKAISERDEATKKLEELNRSLEEAKKELEELRSRKTDVEDDDPLNLDGKKKQAEEDPKKKPLTEEDLDRREKERQDKLEAESKARAERAATIREHLNQQQEEARERYNDFDDSLVRASEIITAATQGKLNDLYADPRRASRVARQVNELLRAYAQADAFEPGEYNAADMTYELGQQHPDFGKPTKKPGADAKGGKKGETDADGNPEGVRRALENASRRGSSASLGGGGSRREVTVDELTEDQAARMSESEWIKLPKWKRQELLGRPK